MGTLKVRARADRFVSDRLAAEAGVRRFVGRVFNPDANPSRDAGALSKPFVVNEKKPFDHRAHFPRVGDVVEVEDCADYRKAVRCGDLLAADEQTAKLCRAKFDDHQEFAEASEPWDAPAKKPSIVPPGNAPSGDATGGKESAK